MPLSEHEQRQLEQIEGALAGEDPWLASILKNFRIAMFIRRPKPEGERRHHTHFLRRNLSAPKFVSRLAKWWQSIPEWLKSTSIILGAAAGLIAGFATFVHHPLAPGNQFMLWCLEYALTFSVGLFAAMYAINWAVKKRGKSQWWWLGVAVGLNYLIGMAFMVALIAITS